ncbi:hypothetical protein MKW92_011648, partial [Papaver armeniacum]
IKNKLLSVESVVKGFIFVLEKETQVSKVGGEVATPAAEKLQKNSYSGTSPS